jgi:hypothetical protein
MSGDTYWIRVQYDGDGELATATVTVSQRAWQQYQVGQRVGLTYAPSRPQPESVNLSGAPLCVLY